jgi:sterol desaturase/sphingolipid hydroxylase (fatty acid hydroxylase superfamily)
MIDIRLICFLISPFIIYSFHASGLVNTLCHINGEPKNVHWQKFINWWGWDHGDHHEYELKKINNSN